MIDSFVILNRKPSIVIKFFLLQVFFLTALVIFGINTYTYQDFFQIHSVFVYQDSYYFLEVLIPVKEVNKITNQNKLWIDSKVYQYQVFEVDNQVIYQNDENYVKIRLKIFNLEEKYLKNGYHVKVKFYFGSKKIIDVLKEDKI